MQLQDDKRIISNPRTPSRCALIVVSCDLYSDLWKPFFTLFWKHWADCPFPVYLTANTKRFDHPKVRMLLSGGESDWSNELNQCLQQVEEPEALLMLEDFFLRDRVDTRALLTAIASWRRMNGRALRVHPRPRPDAKIADTPEFGYCNPGAPYRVSLQATVWRIAALIQVLRQGETPWEFEIAGSARTADEDGFYCSYRSLLPYKTHVLEKGQWYRDAVRTFGPMNIGCDFARRPVMSRWTYARLKWQRVWAPLLGLLPWQTRDRWRKRVTRLPGIEVAIRRILYWQ